MVYRRYSTQQHLAEQRLRLIRSLLDLCYVYSESPQIFHEKFKDKVNIKQLKCYDLIEVSEGRYEGLKDDERLLCALFDGGFSQRELCTIYNVRKLSTMYVKYYRIRTKLEKHSQRPEHCRDTGVGD